MGAGKARQFGACVRACVDCAGSRCDARALFRLEYFLRPGVDGVMRCFDDFTDPGFWSDPAQRFVAVLDAGEPVQAAPGGGFAVLGHDALMAFGRHRLIDGVPMPVEEGSALSQLLSAGLFAQVADSHAILRKQALSGLNTAVIDALQPEMERVVDDLVEHLADGRTFDLAEALVLPAAARFWCRLCGYPFQQADALAHHAGTIAESVSLGAADGASGPDSASLDRAADAVLRLGRETIAQARPGALSIVARAFDGLHREGTGRQELGASGADRSAALIGSMVVDGIDTAAAGVVGVLAWLADRPDRDGGIVFGAAGDPRCWDDRALEAALQEALRLSHPVLLAMRQAQADVDIHGHTIPEGTIVWMWWAAGAVDAARYPEPLEFRAGRDGPMAPVFGTGRHACLGAQAVRSLTRTVLLACFRPGRRLVVDLEQRHYDVGRITRLPRLPARIVR